MGYFWKEPLRQLSTLKVKRLFILWAGAITSFRPIFFRRLKNDFIKIGNKE
jgi:hypothetical protein